jgi:phage-related minor tail protein
MLVQVWKNFLIAALIVICGLLALICNELAHQNQADHAKKFFQEQQAQIEELRRQLADERTRQAERRDVEPPSEQSLKDLAQGFAGLIAGPTPSN